MTRTLPASHWLMPLCTIATELDHCDTQAQLFQEAGRRLHEQGLDLSVWMLTPDGRGLVKQYLAAEVYHPDGMRELNRAINADQFHRPFYSVEPDCALTATLRDGEVRLVESMLDDLMLLRPDLFVDHQDLEYAFPTWRSMYVPLYVAGRIVGILALHHLDLRDEDIPALTAFASLLGASLTSVRRLEAERTQNERLDMAVRIIAEISTTPHSRRALVENTLRALVTHSPCNLAFMGLMESGRLRLATSVNDAAEDRPLDSVGTFSRVARTGKPVLAHFVRAGHADWAPALPVTPSDVVAVPLLGGIETDSSIGVLAIACSPTGALTEDDQHMLETIAGNVVTALSRIQLYEHTRQQASRRAKELHTLLEVGRTVARSLAPDDLLEKLLRAACQAVGASHGHLLHIVEGGEQINIAAVVGLPEAQYVGRVGPMAGSVLEWVVEHDSPLVIADTHAPGWYSGIVKNYWADKPRCILMVPVRRGNEVVGGLALVSSEAGAFDEDDVELTRSISLWAAQALDNAVLYEQTVERQATLDRAIAGMGDALAGELNADDMAHTILQLATSTVKADFGVFTLRKNRGDQGRDHFAAVATLGLEAMSTSTFDLPGAASGLPAWDPEKAVSIIDAQTHPAFSHSEDVRRLGLHSVINVPIGECDKTIGALTLGRDRVEPFSQDEGAFLNAFAPHAGVAMQRAMLTDDIQAIGRHLKSVLQNTSDAILTVDTGGQIEFLNVTSQILSEAFSNEEQQFTVENLLDLTREGKHLRNLWARFAAGFPMEWLVLDVTDRFGAKRRFSAHFSPLPESSRVLIVVKELTGEARLTQMRLEFLRRLQHEIGTPLSSVLGFIHCLLPESRIPPSSRQACIEQAYTQAHRVRRLIRDLQTYTLLAEPLVRPSDTHVSLADIFTLLELHLQREYGITLDSHIDPAVQPVAYHDTQILQLLQHLAEYLIALAGEERPAEGLRIQARPRGNKMEIRLRMPHAHLTSDQMERLLHAEQIDMDRFIGGEDSIGLGIALIRRVVHAVGGDLQLWSSQRLGTIFGLTLPALMETDAS